MVALGGVEVFGINRSARLDPVGLFDLRDIEQHAAANDAAAGDVDRALMSALEIDLALGVEAVVELAAVEVMAERVEMGGREAVGLDREIIGASEGAERMADMAGADHQVRYGHRVVASGRGRERQ